MESLPRMHIEEQMTQCMSAMEKEYGMIRAGRPSKALFANIMVDQNGAATAITHLATVSIPEARQVVIKPWDPTTLDGIVKAISSSELSLNPTSDGKIVRIHFPPLSEERRQEYAKLAKSIAEKNKITIRNIRRDANEHLKAQLKAKEISEDEEHRQLDEVQKSTDHFVHTIDELCKQKEHEIFES